MQILPLIFLFLGSLFAAEDVPSNSRALTAAVKEWTGTQSLEGLVQNLLQDKSIWFLDTATGTVIFSKQVKLNPKELAISELTKLRDLMETGEWTGLNGVRYDFRNVAIWAVDGKVGSFFDLFFSEGSEKPQSEASEVIDQFGQPIRKEEALATERSELAKKTSTTESTDLLSRFNKIELMKPYKRSCTEALESPKKSD